MRTSNIDKVVVITGASSGIGESTAKLLARHGAKVVLGAPAFEGSAMEVREINRSAMIVTARQPVLDWLHSVDPSADKFTLEEVNREPIVYLVPECESDEEFGEWLTQKFEVIFEEQLGGWWTDERSWPATRTLDMFQKWFNCRFHSLVLDLGHDPLSLID